MTDPMEAVTPLPFAQVHVRHGRLVIDALVVEDELAGRLAEQSSDPARFVIDAIGIGARVIDREDTAAHTDVVKAELERVGREVDAAFSEKARVVAEHFGRKVDEVFSPDSGVLTKALERHFSDGSSVAVQHRVRAVLDEVMGRSREELVRQFSAADGSNPLAMFQKAAVQSIHQSAQQQHAHLREMSATIEAMRRELVELRAEKEKREAVAEEAERGTAKGRPYEAAVAEALDAIAHAQGDDCEAVGDFPGVSGAKGGDIVVAIDACSGPARGRIAFEAKRSQLSKKVALAKLDDALAARGADYAVLVVPTDEELPARTPPLREFNGDKLFVTFDPDDGSRLALEVAYALARARVLMKRGASDALDVDAVRSEVERALGAMEDVRRIKQQLTHATDGIEKARTIVEAMAVGVRGHLAAIEALLATADDDGAPEP
jgi:hypothetical protein